MSEPESKQLNLKGLDAFQTKFAEIFAGIAQNPKPLLGLGAVIFVVLLGGYGLRFFVKHKQESRRIELSKVDQVFENEMKTHTKQREAIEKQRDTLKAAQAKPTPAANDAKPVEDSPEIKAFDAQIKALKPDVSASAAMYKSYFQSNPKAPEGWVAGVKYASYAAEKAQLEEAQKVLEELVSNAKDHAVLQTQALFLLVSVLEDRNELDKALERVDALIKVASDDLKPRALLSKAQIYYFKKDYVNASTTATKLLTDFEKSQESDRARSLLALLPE